MAEIRAKLWLEKDSRFVLGAGRAQLLRNIHETGSLAKAAKAMGMSYSHAWSEVREITESLGAPVMETSRGGRSGGSSRLTPEGLRILERFEEENRKLAAYLEKRNK